MNAQDGEAVYRCPNCTGEFPELDNGQCPWCGQPADGSYEYEPRVQTVSTADEKPDETLMERLMK